MSAQKRRVRSRFREKVYARDGYTCVGCGHEDPGAESLDAHHIIDRDEMPGGGYVPENGVTLCKACHRKAEVWHASGKMDCVKGYHPLTLFFRIGSSPEAARAASRESTRRH